MKNITSCYAWPASQGNFVIGIKLAFNSAPPKTLQFKKGRELYSKRYLRGGYCAPREGHAVLLKKINIGISKMHTALHGHTRTAPVFQ